jgi:TrmH family RNA methyltransferase
LIVEQISSLKNNKVKLVNRLRSKRGREHENLFVIDYERDLERALQQDYSIEFVMFCPEFVDMKWITQLGDVDCYEISEQVLNKVSYRENSAGFIAVMQSKPAKQLEELANKEANYLLGLVDLRKPGNIGALLRTADATKVDAILLVDVSLDLYNPNIIRSSTGACFLDTIYQLDSSEAIDYCKHNNIQLVAAYVQGNKTLYDVNFQQKTAIMLGAEDKGLSQQWETNCDHLVNIPMAGRISDSLNVSVSGAVFMYEALRQRHYN